MPDREKAIKGLSRLFDNSGCLAIYDSECDVCPYKPVNGCVDQILKDALELLKAQEAVRPVLFVMDETKTNGVDFICSNCKGDFFRRHVSFCPWCGRPVKWE